MSLAHRLCAPHLVNLTPYQSARRIGGNGEIFINANESPAALIDNTNVHLYPGDSVDHLTASYARYAGVNTEQCITGRGADEAIELLIRTFCVPGTDQVAQYVPTYGMYAISAQTHNVACANLDYHRLLFGDLNQIDELPQLPKLVFVCNPNNPTGELLPRKTIVNLVEKLQDKAIVVVDEAYGDFVPEQSMAECIERYDNLVVLRTMSKAFALAGARIGFALANVDIIRMMAKVIAPYPVAEPVAKLGLAALSPEGITAMANNVEEIKRQRGRLISALQTMPQVEEVFDAKGNYVLARIKDAQNVFDNLKAKGIIARDQSKQPGLANCLRFTVGSADQITNLIDALQP